MIQDVKFSVEKFSGLHSYFVPKIEQIKKSNYYFDSTKTVIGDAPKNLIRIYKYSCKYHKKNKYNWPLYIAKFGHKWYPNESITEYLLNLLGLCFGLEMAESSLVMIKGQLRYLSKYFLKHDEELIHGADIFSAYLGDKDLVEEIENQGYARDLFGLRFVEDSVSHLFPAYKNDIMSNLVKLLLFDALVGNNDRHFYNWGVIRSVTGNNSPRLSPIYDTARGLFWNDSESKLMKLSCSDFKMEEYIENYCERSKPKLGWETETEINHYRLVELIYKNEFYISKSELKSLFLQNVFDDMCNVIDREMEHLMSPLRIRFIKRCLKVRFSHINELCK